jgi:formaldehyde-activating enzyme involved in methanogenesis
MASNIVSTRGRDDRPSGEQVKKEAATTQESQSKQVSFQGDARVGWVAKACGQMVEAGGRRRDQKTKWCVIVKQKCKISIHNPDIFVTEISIVSPALSPSTRKTGHFTVRHRL